jgi:NhaP-type Na+/H+ or K+/H+ antiporter
MWNFLLGFLLARATGISRFVRPLLLFVLIGALIAGIIYAVGVFHAVQEGSSAHHVQHHSTR